MLVVQMFFGRDIPGRTPLSDAEWADFATQIISKQFPDGFTAYDGEGQWRDPATGTVVREPSKILIAAIAPSKDMASKLDTIMDAYRTRFSQVSVGLVTGEACAAF